MATRTRSARVPRQRRREQIVEVAVEMFSATEYEDVSVDEICRRADVAKGLAFYHFTDKRGLFAAAVAHVWTELATAQQPRPDELDADSRMRGYLRRHFQYVLEHPHRFLILMSIGHANAEVREVVARARAHAIAGITGSLGCPVDPPPRLRQAVNSWSHFVDSVALDWIAHRDTTIEQMTDVCTQALVAAVRSAAGRSVDPRAALEVLTQVMSETSAPGGTTEVA